MNWQRLIQALVGSGLTQPQIAAACQCGQSTISELLRGVTRDPRHSLGEAVIRLGRKQGLDPAQFVAAGEEVRDAA